MKQEGWDRLGIGVSGVCMVHCLLLPVVISALPMWASAQQVHGWLHPVFAVLLVPTTILALVSGYRRHRNVTIVALMTIGLILVLAAAFPALESPGVVYETVMTMTGSVFLITGHFRNWKLGRACRMPVPDPAAASSVGERSTLESLPREPERA
ncbi:MAG: MerC domain-containing protein [Rhodothermales bacterium]